MTIIIIVFFIISILMNSPMIIARLRSLICANECMYTCMHVTAATVSICQDSCDSFCQQIRGSSTSSFNSHSSSSSHLKFSSSSTVLLSVLLFYQFFFFATFRTMKFIIISLPIFIFILIFHVNS